MTIKNLENKNVKHKFDVVYKIWLGIMDMFQTFEDDSLEWERDIQNINELLDKNTDNDI